MLYVGVSALAEPFAALLAWLFLGDHLTDTVFGVLFGATAGMMAMVALEVRRCLSVRLLAVLGFVWLACVCLSC